MTAKDFADNATRRFRDAPARPATEAALKALLPDVDDALARNYAHLAATTGVGTTNADVHAAWAAWRLETRPDHPALVPFSDLDAAVQELDTPYRDAIRATA